MCSDAATHILSAQTGSRLEDTLNEPDVESKYFSSFLEKENVEMLFYERSKFISLLKTCLVYIIFPD